MELGSSLVASTVQGSSSNNDTLPALKMFEVMDETVFMPRSKVPSYSLANAKMFNFGKSGGNSWLD
ncbi:MAG: hypothetical protein AMJ55_00010 [Gammaproteobacteria bacterium SG8_15]|nr:MAG: hypothetical protein AMJ55_00010 [Gammaproteobacteria bacterium SG8_15]